MQFSGLEQLRKLCRDEAAFDRLQQILVDRDRLWMERQQALFHVIARIRESLDLNTIFTTTATEVRQLLQADRVGMFYFYPDSGWNDGEFVSEAVLPQFNSALAARVHDHCFGKQYAIHYQQGRIQAVSDIQSAGLQDCHIKVLSQFQIRANLVVPLLQGDHLWGLLCIHQCSNSREWQPDEIEFVTKIAIHLGVALQQAELLHQIQQQAIDLAQTLERLQRSQTQLIQSEKMSSLGQLVAGVAHEINNPVNFIYGNLSHANRYAQDLLELLNLYRRELKHPSPDLLDRSDAADLDFLVEDFPKILASMQMGADRIRQIVLSLRNFSRLDEAEMKPVDLHEGLDSTLLILQYRLKSSAHSSGIKIIKEYGDLPLVECYASQINQVFMNLLSNAIDALESLDEVKPATQPERHITIRTTLEPSSTSNLPHAVIRISDNGTGIPIAIQSRLFDPFFTTKSAGKGTGLGLSISYQIVVERHGGRLDCTSELGQGTEFLIKIPICQPQSIAPSSTHCTIGE